MSATQTHLTAHRTRADQATRPSAGWLLASCVASLLLAASPVGAQTVTVSLSGDVDTAAEDDDGVTFNISQCRDLIGDELTFDVDFESENQTDGTIVEVDSYVYKIEPEGVSCDTDDTSADNDDPDCERIAPTSSTPPDEDVPFTQFFPAISNPDDCFDVNGQSGRFLVVYSNTDPDTDTISREAFTITMRASRPGAPSLDELVPGEETIEVKYTEPSDAPDSDSDESAYDYRIYYAAVAADDAGTPTETVPISEGGSPELLSVQTKEAGSGQSYSLSGVSVNTTYVVAVVAMDEYGNESLVSNVLTTTTRPTNDFYEAYRGNGGGDAGGFGCSVTPGSTRIPWAPLAALLGLAVVGLVRRRRDAAAALVAAVTLSGLLLAPGAANAQDLGVDDNDPTGSLEIRLGGYTPQVDEAFSGNGPYEQIFNDESMLLAELEFGRYFGRLGGAWGGGFGFGFMQAVGKSVDDMGNSSVDTTVFNIIPLRLHATYKVDLLARKYNVPFVPVFKLGGDYYFWWITDGQGAIAQDEGGGKGRGGTFGWHGAIAIHLLLDTLDQRAATNLQFDFGIYNTYLFAEYLIAEVDDFGSSSSIILSDQTFMFGLAFDY